MLTARLVWKAIFGEVKEQTDDSDWTIFDTSKTVIASFGAVFILGLWR